MAIEGITYTQQAFNEVTVTVTLIEHLSCQSIRETVALLQHELPRRKPTGYQHSKG